MPTCRPPSWRELFRCELVILQVGGSIFGTDLSSSNLERRISCPRCRLSDGNSASRNRKTPPQLAGSLFGTTMSSRKLRQAFLVQRCRPASCGKLFRCEFVIPQLAGANFVSEMQFVRWGICISMAEMQIPHRTMAFPRPKPSLVSLLLHLWLHSYKNKPQTTFRVAVWGSCLCSVFTVAGGFPFPLPIGRALFVVYPADDLFDRWFLAVHEHAHAVDLCPDPRHQYEASVQQADA